MEIIPSSCENSGIDIYSEGKRSDLKYAGDAVLLSEDPRSFWFLLDRLNDSIVMFGMRFISPKCKISSQDLTSTKPNLVLAGEELDDADCLNYLSSCVSSSGRKPDELSPWVQKFRLAFNTLKHLWRRRDIQFLIKGLGYTAAAKSVMLYDPETWPLTAKDIETFSVFEYRSLRGASGI